MNSDIHADRIKELTTLLKNNSMKNRDEVESFIRNFKSLVYDYKMIGLLYDFYMEEIEILRENRKMLYGLYALVKDTTELLSAFPDMSIELENIIINGNEKDGYKAFCRARYRGTNLGPSPYGLATGKSLGNSCMELSLINLKKIKGQWKIIDEMTMTSRDLIIETLRGHATNSDSHKNIRRKGIMKKDSYMTDGNDSSKTAESMRVIIEMGQALEENSNDMNKYFHQDFNWFGNYGCGKKNGLNHFRRGWQLPLRQAFSDRKYHTEAQFAQGQWVAAFGYIDALHTGEFMGVEASNKRIKIKFMDIWKVEDGKIVNNWVNVDFPDILKQLDVDVFDGKGWEKMLVDDPCNS